MTKHGSTTRRLRGLWIAIILCIACPVGLVGCGGTTLAPVKGTVKYKGSPVKGGNLTFAPVGKGGEAPGRPAVATVQQDGTYKLTTEGREGAVAARHMIVYNPPGRTEEWKDTKSDPPPPPYMGLVPRQTEVEVKSGENTIDIELVPGRRK